jgi:hypothetical protein
MQTKVCLKFYFEIKLTLFLFRIREQLTFVQSLRSIPTYSEIPVNIREYLEYGSKTNIQQQFDPLRTLTPTSNLPPPTTASPQPQISHSPSMFPRMNSGPPITNQQQYTTGNGGGGAGGGGVGVGRENPSQKGVNLYCIDHFLWKIFVRLAIINSKCQYSDINE